MDELTEKPQRDMAARVGLILLALALLGLGGLWTVGLKVEQMNQLAARWVGEQIHVHSPKDGPWLVTHLIAYKTAGRHWRAVAQLPVPVTILESGGRCFSQEEISRLPWLDSAGAKQTPPVVGEPVGVLYVVPLEGRRP